MNNQERLKKQIAVLKILDRFLEGEILIHVAMLEIEKIYTIKPETLEQKAKRIIMEIMGIDKLNGSQKKEQAHVRHIVMWYLINKGYSQEAAAWVFRKDRATAYHSHKRIEGYRTKDPRFRDKIYYPITEEFLQKMENN